MLSVNFAHAEKTRYADLHGVKVTDPFYRPFLDKLRRVSVPDVFRKFEGQGVMENYFRVARGEAGGHAGEPWFNALICETVRGCSDLISSEYDPALDAEMDRWIAAISRAQGPDGWLHPYVTLQRPGMEWGLNGGNARYQHETYNCGCIIEAGVHHYRATGKTTMLVPAIKTANYLADRIGEPPKWNIACEHSIAELAVLSLERLCREEPEKLVSLGARPGEYLRLARFWYANKGNNRDRHQFPQYLREYAQDHRPATEQREAVGHAVRAVLCYAGMADCAVMAGDGDLADAAVALWRDIAETKFQINGSVGAIANEECFGAQYELPNDAYLETCAGAGLLFFAARMFRLTGDASVWDIAESIAQNLLPVSVAEDGTHYTYQNPLESDGSYRRWSWHGCPCCPPMLFKAAGALPSYIFAERGERIYLNMYIDADAAFPGAEVSLKGAARGKTLRVTAEGPRAVAVRIPDWARNFTLSLPYTTEDGYAVASVPAGETEIAIGYDAPPVKVMAHPLVAANRGKVAVKRGPVLYCLETGRRSLLEAELDARPPVANADGTLTVFTTDGEAARLIEYRRWNNGEPLPMRVWFRQAGYTPDPADLSGWEGRLYREYEG